LLGKYGAFWGNYRLFCSTFGNYSSPSQVLDSGIIYPDFASRQDAKAQRVFLFSVSLFLCFVANLQKLETKRHTYITKITQQTQIKKAVGFSIQTF